MKAEEKTKKGSKLGLKDIIRLLVVLIVAILLFTWAYLKPEVGGFLAAYYFGSAIAAWLIVRVTLLLGASGVISLVAFIAFYVALLGGGLLGKENSKSNLKGMLSEIQKTAQVGYDAVDEHGAAVTVPEINMEVTSSGDAGIIEAYYKNYMAQYAKIQNTYVTAFTRIRWERILDPERLAHDSTLSHSNQVISQARGFVATYIEDILELSENYRQGFHELEFNSFDKKATISSFEEGYASTLADVEKNLQYEESIMEQVASIISYLDTNQDSWEIQDGLIAFETDEQVQAYETLYAELNLLTTEQENLRLNMERKQRKKSEALLEELQ